jgi:hypothetical protein
VSRDGDTKPLARHHLHRGRGNPGDLIDDVIRRPFRLAGTAVKLDGCELAGQVQVLKRIPELCLPAKTRATKSEAYRPNTAYQYVRSIGHFMEARYGRVVAASHGATLWLPSVTSSLEGRIHKQMVRERLGLGHARRASVRQSQRPSSRLGKSFGCAFLALPRRNWLRPIAAIAKRNSRGFCRSSLRMNN